MPNSSIRNENDIGELGQSPNIPRTVNFSSPSVRMPQYRDQIQDTTPYATNYTQYSEPATPEPATPQPQGRTWGQFVTQPSAWVEYLSGQRAPIDANSEMDTLFERMEMEDRARMNQLAVDTGVDDFSGGISSPGYRSQVSDPERIF